MSETLFYIYVAFGVLLGVITICGLVRFPGKPVVLGGLFLALLGIGYYGFATLLAQPKPVEMMLAWDRPEGVEEASVLGSYMVEDEAIYLLLIWDGIDTPRYYRFPWSMKAAQQLYNAQSKAQKEGTGVTMKQPFNNPLFQGEGDNADGEGGTGDGGEESANGQPVDDGAMTGRFDQSLDNESQMFYPTPQEKEMIPKTLPAAPQSLPEPSVVPVPAPSPVPSPPAPLERR